MIQATFRPLETPMAPPKAGYKSSPFRGFEWHALFDALDAMNRREREAAR